MDLSNMFSRTGLIFAKVGPLKKRNFEAPYKLESLAKIMVQLVSLERVVIFLTTD
jgi:hypothetical protein